MISGALDSLLGSAFISAEAVMDKVGGRSIGLPFP
jgi:hypothetical protein